MRNIKYGEPWQNLIKFCKRNKVSFPRFSVQGSPYFYILEVNLTEASKALPSLKKEILITSPMFLL